MVFDSQWPPLYPATAFVVGIPFTLLADRASSIVFSVLSTFFLGYGITKDGWHRLPIFLSVPFFWSAVVAQWSIILTAALFLPWLAAYSASKPHAAIPVVLASEKPSLSIKASLLGGILLLAASLAMMPSWPAEWLATLGQAGHIRAPLLGTGGFLVLLVLFRWRDRDSRLLLLMSAIPQVWYPYSVLPILAIPKTLRESLILVSASTLLILPNFITKDIHALAFASRGRLIILAGVYLPAVIIIMTRSALVRLSRPSNQVGGRVDDG